MRANSVPSTGIFRRYATNIRQLAVEKRFRNETERAGTRLPMEGILGDWCSGEREGGSWFDFRLKGGFPGGSGNAVANIRARVFR